MENIGNTKLDNTNKSKTGRKKDNIREYYDIKDDKLYCKLSNCDKAYSGTTSLYALRDHIKYFHGNMLSKNNNNNNMDNSINNNMNNIINKNDAINETFLEQENKIYHSFAIAFSKNSLPYSLFEDKYFINALLLINKNIKLSKSKLKDTIISEGEIVKNTTINMLSINRQPVTLALDGWTNVRNNKVINILLICSGVAYYFASIENQNNHTNSEWLVNIIEEKLNFLINKGLNIIAITTDNENLMKSVKNKLNKKFPVLIIIPCSAHILNLCLKKICTIDRIKELINDTVDVINSIKNNISLKIKLIELQKKDNIKEPLKLIRPVETRWTSLIISIERILKLQKYIEIIVEKDGKYWSELNSFYDFIKLFNSSINSIQRDDATLYSFWKNFENIINFYKSQTNHAIFQNIAENIITCITDKWNDHININIIEAVRLFSLEKNFKYSKKTVEFINEWGSNYLYEYKIVDEKKIDDIKKELHLQFSEFISRNNEFKFINSENDKLENTYKQQNKTYNTKLIWAQFLHLYYELSNIAMALLSICPSEACVERSFSIQSYVHSLERNRLSNDMINAEMNIKMNVK